MLDDSQKPRVERLIRDSETLATSAERAAFLRGAFHADDRLKDSFAQFCADIAPGALGESEGSTRELAAEDVPGIEDLELIAEGGMGRVYRGTQRVPLKREVAVKVLKGTTSSDQILKRFELERQTLAVLNHPSIAKVFDAGVTPRGDAYFVMELIQGETLMEVVRSRSLDLRARLALFAEVCRGVTHAHQKGVVHRDLKPSNILVVETDGRLIPKIIDFGIAKAIESRSGDAALTMESQLLGTPAYMSPEQADIARGDVDTRADVYSLGTILYELVTGALPFDQEMLMADGYAGMLRMLSERVPVVPSRRLRSLKRDSNVGSGTAASGFADRLDADVDAIVMKAIEKDRDLRYPSAEALRGDIMAYLEQRPVLARRAGWGYFARKFVGRHRSLCFGIVGVLGLVVIGVLLLAEYADDLAASNESLNQRLYIADMTAALQAREQTDLQRVDELISRHGPDAAAADGVDRREFEWYFLQAELARFRSVPALTFDAGVYEIALDPERNLLVAAGYGSDFIWVDVDTRTVLKMEPIGGEHLTRDLTFSPDLQRLVASCTDLVVFSAAGEIENRYPGNPHEMWARFSPDGEWIVHGGIAGAVGVWHPESNGHEILEPAFAETHWVQRVFFTPDQRYVVGSCHQEIMVWDFQTRDLVARWHPHLSRDGQRVLDIGAFVLSPDGDSVITAGATDSKVKVFETTTGKLRQDDNGPLVRDAVSSMAPICLNTTGDRLYIADEKNTIRVLDLMTGALTDPVPGHSRAVTGMTLTADEKWLITSGVEGKIKFWDTTELGRPGGFRTGFGESSHLSFSPDGASLAVCLIALDGKTALEVFDKSTRELRQRLEAPEVIYDFRYSADGQSLAGGGFNGVYRWRPSESSESELVWQGQQGDPLGPFAFDEELAVAAVKSRELPLRLIDLAAGTELWRARDPGEGMSRLVLKRIADNGPDASPYYLLVAGNAAGDLRWWRMQISSGGVEIRDRGGLVGVHDKTIMSMAISGDGRLLATGGFDSKIKIWDTESFVERAQFLAHTGWVYDVEFSPSGKTLASGSMDNLLRLWDLEEMEAKGFFQEHESYVVEVAFSPDGMDLASAGDDGYVVIREGGAALGQSIP